MSEQVVHVGWLKVNKTLADDSKSALSSQGIMSIHEAEPNELISNGFLRSRADDS